jgi:predicted phosphate transport protein (TIGR00153 family)
MYLFNKNKILLEKYTNYLNLCAETIEIFREAIEHSMKNGLDEHYGVLARKVHEKESDADGMRRIIECEMFEQSLLPESREDLLDIIESIDAIPNGADHLATLLTIQKTEIIPSLKKDISELLSISVESFKYTREAALDCFMKMQRIKELQTLIKNTESIGDTLEHGMIRMIFEEQTGMGEKIIQKDIVYQIGDICNMCEHVMDRIVICSIKRKL